MPDSEIKDLVKYRENKSLTNCDLPESETNQHDDGNKEGNSKVGVFLPTSALSAGVQWVVQLLFLRLSAPPLLFL